MKITKAISKFGTILFYLTLVLCLLLSVTMIRAKVSGKQPEILGYKLFVVLTGSMEPNLGVGDLIIVKTTDPEEIKTNDIITFQSEASENIITHRVKQISNDKNLEFITKGDANNIEDPNNVKKQNIIGRVSGHIPQVGSILKYVQANGSFVLGIIIAISLIAAFANRIRKVRISKRSKSA